VNLQFRMFFSSYLTYEKNVPAKANFKILKTSKDKILISGFVRFLHLIIPDNPIGMVILARASEEVKRVREIN
jgi:hypothetical protein